jgi:hypothetical protein
MRTAGIVLFVIGIIGTLVFGIQAIQQTETFNFLGIEIGVSTANWAPVIVSAVVMLAGIFMIGSGRRMPS